MATGTRGVSPVVATVLLLTIVVVLASIVFLWAQGFVQESAQKNGSPVERACDSTDFEADVVTSSIPYILEINNRANVPLYGFDVKLLGDGTARLHHILGENLDVGKATQIPLLQEDVPELYNQEVNELLVIPVLLGSRGEAQEQHRCDDRYGRGITILG